MKLFYTLLLTSALLFVNNSFAQDPKSGVFSLLSGIKNSSEFELRKSLMKQELEVSAIVSDKTNNKAEAKRLQNYIDSEKKLKAYNALKLEVDQLVDQLKADMIMSNSRKQLKRLNLGTTKDPWYQHKINNVQKKYVAFLTEIEQKQFAVSLEEITGAFSAVVTVFTSARDFRAAKVKALCELLDGMKLRDFSELSSPAKSESSKAE